TGTVSGQFSTLNLPGGTNNWTVIYNTNSIQLNYTPPQTYTWIGGFGNWADPLKWTPNGVPDADDDVLITSGGTTVSATTFVKNLTGTGGSIIGNATLNIINNVSMTGFVFGEDGTSGTVNAGGITTTNLGVVYSKIYNANGGTIWASNDIRVAQGGIFRNPVGKTLTAGFAGTNSFTNQYGGIGTFENLGTFLLTNGGTANIAIPFIHSGDLKGNGTVWLNSTFTSTGSFSPGVTIGELTLQRSSVSNTTLNIEIGGASGPGTGNDRLKITGNFVAGGTLNVSLLNGYTPASGTTFEIVLTTGTVNGTFSSTNLASLPGTWSVQYLSNKIVLQKLDGTPVNYTWADGTASWTDPLKWTPFRFSPAATDIITFSNAGTITVTNIPVQTIAQLLVSNNTALTIQPVSAGVTLSINGSTGTDLSVASGCQLNIGGPNALIINVSNGATGSIYGNMTFTG
ncbi:MAG TPA: hypothetical protein VN763_04585, partial [Saprospiraceae bacterium]|nr:hypothetical protein [Saprospiraceae bacterium]